MSLGSNHELKEVVGDKGPLYWVLKLEEVKIQLPPLEGGKVVLNIEEFLPLFPLGNPRERAREIEIKRLPQAPKDDAPSTLSIDEVVFINN